LKSTFVLAIVLAVVLGPLAAPEVMAQPKSSNPAADEHAVPVKELNEFHDALHPLVHDSMPKGDLNAVRAKLDLLQKRAVAVQKAPIPKEFASRSKEYDRLSAQLTKQVNELKALKRPEDREAFTKTFDAMHETYEELAGLVR
jgi:hypothetical protein